MAVTARRSELNAIVSHFDVVKGKKEGGAIRTTLVSELKPSGSGLHPKNSQPVGGYSFTWSAPNAPSTWPFTKWPLNSPATPDG